MELDINKALKKSFKRGFLEGSYRKIAAKSGGYVHTQGKFILKISSCETKRSKMFVRKCADNKLHLRYFNCHHQHAMIVCPNDKRKNTIRIYFYHLLNVIRNIPKFNLYSRKIMSYFDCWCYYRTSIIFILALEFLHMQIRMSVCRKWFLSTVFLPLPQQVALNLQQHLTDAHKNSRMFVFMLTNITMRIISHILKAYLFLLTVWLNSVFLTSRGISKEILMIINLCCM